MKKKQKKVCLELTKDEILEMMGKAIAFDLLVEMRTERKSIKKRVMIK